MYLVLHNLHLRLAGHQQRYPLQMLNPVSPLGQSGRGGSERWRPGHSATLSHHGLRIENVIM